MLSLLQMPDCTPEVVVSSTDPIPPDTDLGLSLAAGMVPGVVLLVLSLLLLASANPRTRLKGAMMCGMGLMLGLYPTLRFVVGMLGCDPAWQDGVRTLLPFADVALVIGMACTGVLLVSTWRKLRRKT